MTIVIAPSPKLSPSKTLADSITRGSMTGVSPRTAASGAPVSWARSSGDVRMCTMSRSPIVSAIRWAIVVAEVGEVEPVAAAVEHALGVVDLAVPQQVDGGLDAHVSDLLPWRPRARPRGARR